MTDVTKRARDAADRLRRVVGSTPLGPVLEDQQRNLNDLLTQVQNSELRSKLSSLFDQQQKVVVDLLHAVQTSTTAQQQHLNEMLAALEATLQARRAKFDDAEPVDDLTDDTDDDEPPRAAPFADVAPFATPNATMSTPPTAPKAPPKKRAAAKKRAAKNAAAATPDPVGPLTDPVEPLNDPAGPLGDPPTPLKQAPTPLKKAPSTGAPGGESYP